MSQYVNPPGSNDVMIDGKVVGRMETSELADWVCDALNDLGYYPQPTKEIPIIFQPNSNQ